MRNFENTAEFLEHIKPLQAKIIERKGTLLKVRFDVDNVQIKANWRIECYSVEDFSLQKLYKILIRIQNKLIKDRLSPANVLYFQEFQSCPNLPRFLSICLGDNLRYWYDREAGKIYNRPELNKVAVVLGESVVIPKLNLGGPAAPNSEEKDDVEAVTATTSDSGNSVEAAISTHSSPALPMAPPDTPIVLPLPPSDISALPAPIILATQPGGPAMFQLVQQPFSQELIVENKASEKPWCLCC